MNYEVTFIFMKRIGKIMEKLEPKAPKVENTLEALGNIAFGRSRKEAMRKGICVSCGKPAFKFKDEISAKEFDISGLCQKCQDDFFEPDDKDDDYCADCDPVTNPKCNKCLGV
jgi:hypothetical protein